jgi:cytidylate kinase
LSHPNRREGGRPLIVAIDGPAAAGKSTIAALLARRLGLPYLDTGSMYRAVAWLAVREGIRAPIAPEAAGQVVDLLNAHRIELELAGSELRVLVDGTDVADQIRTPEVAMMASAVSALPAVRRQLVALQRELGLRSGGVMEGRDITTVVFPDARLRVFLTASTEERARRRHRDLGGGEAPSLDEVRRQQQQRDCQDTTRVESPLHVAEGVIVIDTTDQSPEEVVRRLLEALESAAAPDP